MPYPASMVQLAVATRLGPVRLAASPVGLAGLWFEGQRHEPVQRLHGPAAWPEASAHPVLWAASRQLAEYLSGERAAFDLPLDLSSGTVFQQEVWHALLTVGRGTTTSYGALGRQLGRSQAVRAVGAAVGRNPLSIVVPCHRIVGANGSLTGYAAGLERKAALLALEGAVPPLVAPVDSARGGRPLAQACA
ncbi:methylated-DNA--[protein]-cysteine S-methyltransferase [Acidovorax sp.]|uniref:methylated-DNA--[protein]-cysteine S-methyltransferase n=1 Tax=Acidovorax sp. TaxID=1872122 RepID=UPI00391EFFE6